LLGEIARGGMGVVYQARQTKLNRLVALKMIRSGELADTEQVRRFYAEAEAAAKLDHSGIVPIHEVGECNGQHFYSMAFVAGASLNELVKQDGPLAPRRAAELMAAVAVAVQFAHERSLIHRDLKPQNILLDEQGRPRVTDFGLAKHVQRSQDLTVEGQVMGTPSYMPPEQAKGAVAEIGPRSDVYSLGATLYFLLTGRPPFQTASTAETIRQVLEIDPLPPRRLNAAIPRDLETICLKCLRKESGRRYKTAIALADDLQRWLDGRPIIARRVGVRERAWLWCKRRPAVATMIFVTLLTVTVGGFAFEVQRRRTTQQRADALVDALLTASAEGVPYALDNLRPVGNLAVAHLKAEFEKDGGSRAGQLHAAYGLAEFGEAPLEFLLRSIRDVPSSECRNIVTALEHVKTAALPALIDRAGEPYFENWTARYAILALHLGDTPAAENVLAIRPNPVFRTAFIHAYRDWHADFSTLAALLLESSDEAFRSGLCEAVGLAAPPNFAEYADVGMNLSSFPGPASLVPVLPELYASAPDGGTHSAAGWALRAWNYPLPRIEPTADLPPGKRWHVNSQGMTMIEIPPAKFLMGVEAQASTDVADGTKVARPFLLCDREVTIGEFQRFIDDVDYPASEKPDHWPGPYKFEDQTPDCPVQMVSWYEAVLYCNWLSKRDGRQPCYARSGRKEVVPQVQKGKPENVENNAWECDFTQDGYRLPTQTEWEYACRAGSTTAYSFGDHVELLTAYAWFVNNSRSRPWLGALKLPNAWGLFDMHGNVCEWCNDSYDSSTGLHHVLRGGGWANDAAGCRSMSSSGIQLASRSHILGFRLARSSVQGTGAQRAPDPLSQATDSSLANSPLPQRVVERPVSDHWKYKDAQTQRGEFRRLADGRWEEIKDGKHWSFFKEVQRSKNSVELFDKGRSIWVRVGPRHALWKKEGQEWTILFPVERLDSENE
jgi:formylglycine-generating enzyme required for sulfatase activity/tRNA A-37 threonylcarbamoyl transferase component Bud32